MIKFFRKKLIERNKSKNHVWPVGKYSLYTRGKMLMVMAGILTISFSQAQDVDKGQILAQREASNQALRAFDEELNATFLTEDVFIITGAGTLIAGKKALFRYIQSDKGSKMYWIRTPEEVIVNPETQLAWETGTWKGYSENSEEPVVGGKYSAQWTKASGTWLIRSQLFVTLEN